MRMLAGRKVLWLVGLAVVAAAMAGCAPRARFEVATDVQPTVTAAPAATPTVAYTPTPRPTDTETVTPSPTPDRFTLEAMTKIPHSQAEIPSSCVEIVSPIDNPDQYSKDMDKYLDVLHNQIFPSWKGAVISGDKNWLGITGQRIYFAHGAEIEPAACARFKYQGKDVVMMSLVAQDDNGLFAINIIFDPIGIDASSVGGYGTPDQILPRLPVTLKDGVAGSTWFDTACDIYTGPGSATTVTQFIKDYFGNPDHTGLWKPLGVWEVNQKHVFDRGADDANEKRALVFQFMH